MEQPARWGRLYGHAEKTILGKIVVFIDIIRDYEQNALLFKTSTLTFLLSSLAFRSVATDSIWHVTALVA